MKPFRTTLTAVLFSFLLALPARAGAVSDFVSGVSHTLFTIGWPTAKYEDYEIEKVKSYSWGYTVDLKLKGKSSFCLVGKCPLWFELRMSLNNDLIVKDLKVLNHNAIMMPPFATSGALAVALAESNRH